MHADAVARSSKHINRSNQTQMGGGGNDVVKSTNTNEIQILSAGYQKPAKTEK